MTLQTTHNSATRISSVTGMPGIKEQIYICVLFENSKNMHNLDINWFKIVATEINFFAGIIYFVLYKE